jgi:UDP-2,3-diacylglucosamine pyrophosphatase LpxH
LKRALLALFAAACALAWQPVAPSGFRFVLLGDRTGEAQPGIWERIWQEVAASKPAFVLSVGDTIQGLNDATAEAEWKTVMAGLAPYRAIPLYLTPGNHDIWSAASEELYRRYSKRATHYGFDSGGAHVTVLDNSRGDALTPVEMEFLESDLAAHEKAAVKFVVMHRPSWVLDAALRNTAAPLHQTVKRHGVRWVLAGHVHQLIRAELEGVTYFAAPSAGGHLRLTGKYEDGWFFGWTAIDVKGADASFTVHELGGRTTPLNAWGLSGLSAH